MNPYVLLLGNDFKLKIVDTREDMSNLQCIGYTSSTWKKVFTAGQRRYNNKGFDLHRGNTYILTYGKGHIVVANPGKGDYIPPGYEFVSCPLEEILNGYAGIQCLSRARLVPLEGAYIFNNTLKPLYKKFSVFKQVPDGHLLKGWFISTASDNSTRNCSMIGSEEEGIKCQWGGGRAVVTQTLCKERVESKTSLGIRCEGAIGIEIGGTPLTRDDDGIWRWEGDPIVEDIPLSIVIGDLHYVRNVEFLDE